MTFDQQKQKAKEIAEDFANYDNITFEEAADLAELIREIAERENW